MWLYRLGLTRAQEYALTGKPLSGREAADICLINEAVPFEDLEETVGRRAEQMASIPSSQLAAMKLVVNHAFENMGTSSTQTLGPILDGLMRNTPEALRFVDRAAAEGVRAVIEERDGLFGDFIQRRGALPRTGRSSIRPEEVVLTVAAVSRAVIAPVDANANAAFGVDDTLHLEPQLPPTQGKGLILGREADVVDIAVPMRNHHHQSVPGSPLNGPTISSVIQPP